MLSKEVFCRAIKNIKEQQARTSEFNDALDKICDGFPVFDVNNLYLESLLEVLKESMNDIDDYISWWLYEDVEKTVWVTKDNKTITYNLNTPEDLYDFLTK